MRCGERNERGTGGALTQVAPISRSGGSFSSFVRSQSFGANFTLSLKRSFLFLFYGCPPAVLLAPVASRNRLI